MHMGHANSIGDVGIPTHTAGRRRRVIPAQCPCQTCAQCLPMHFSIDPCISSLLRHWKSETDQFNSPVTSVTLKSWLRRPWVLGLFPTAVLGSLGSLQLPECLASRRLVKTSSLPGNLSLHVNCFLSATMISELNADLRFEFVICTSAMRYHPYRNGPHWIRCQGNLSLLSRRHPRLPALRCITDWMPRNASSLVHRLLALRIHRLHGS